MEKLKIVQKDFSIKEVDCLERLMIEDLPCFLHIDEDGEYTVSHLETGTRLMSYFTKELAIDYAKTQYKYTTKPNPIEEVRQLLRDNGITLPVNT